MVNFKASGHAGEHKRALAAQTTEHKAVSKAEKLAWSQKEGMLAAVPADAVVLRVVCREKVLQENNALVKAALVHESAITKLGAAGAALSGSGAPLVSRPGGDLCCRRARTRRRPRTRSCSPRRSGCRSTSARARRTSGGPSARAPARPTAAAARRPRSPRWRRRCSCCSRWRAARTSTSTRRSSAAPPPSGSSARCSARTSSSSSATRAPPSSSASSRSRCRRPKEPATTTPSATRTASAASSTHRGVRLGVDLAQDERRAAGDGEAAPPRRRAARPPRPPRNELLVTTSDGEVFPVLKPLLKPCIALTKAVRQKEEGDGRRGERACRVRHLRPRPPLPRGARARRRRGVQLRHREPRGDGAGARRAIRRALGAIRRAFCELL